MPTKTTSARKRKDSEASPSPSIYNELSLEQKLLVIKDSEGISSRKLAEKYSVGKTSILRITALKSELKEAAETPENLSSKRVKRSTKNDDVDSALVEFFRKCREPRLHFNRSSAVRKSKIFRRVLWD